MSSDAKKGTPVEGDDQIFELGQQMSVEQHFCSSCLPHEAAPQLQVVVFEGARRQAAAPEVVIHALLWDTKQ